MLSKIGANRITNVNTKHITCNIFKITVFLTKLKFSYIKITWQGSMHLLFILSFLNVIIKC